MVLQLDRLSLHRGPRQILDDVSLSLRAGELSCLIGPNGAGKTSLMRAALGLLPFTGRSNLAELDPSERARQAGWLPQDRQIAWPVSVRFAVALGRLPWRGLASRAEDEQAIDEAIAALELEHLADRPVTELSGGERARVLVARLLAGSADCLLADEPAAGLDPAQQLGLMENFSARAKQGKAVLISSHELGLAARYADRVILLHQGRIYADGPARTVLDAANMAEVFGISAYFSQTGMGPIFQPVARIGKSGDRLLARDDRQ